MKRYGFLVLALVLFAGPLMAGVDRDVLLTEDGTLYTVQSLPDRTLALTIQRGEESTTKLVPATETGGKHFQPSLAYDPATRTLFLFWELQPNRMGSFLLVCSYRDGEWSNERIIEGGGFRYPINLRIAVTTLVTSGEVSENRFLLHLVWWEQSSEGEFARFTTLATRDGVVDESLPAMKLVHLLGASYTPLAPPSDPSAREFLRHPAIFPNATHDSFDVVFGDFNANRMHRVTVKPIIENGVLVPPIGVTKRQIALPRLPIADAGLNFINSGGSDNMAVYFTNDGSLSYMLYKNSAWTPIQKLTISDELSLEIGIQALKRLLSSH